MEGAPITKVEFYIDRMRSGVSGRDWGEWVYRLHESREEGFRYYPTLEGLAQTLAKKYSETGLSPYPADLHLFLGKLDDSVVDHRNAWTACGQKHQVGNISDEDLGKLIDLIDEERRNEQKRGRELDKLKNSLKGRRR